MLIKQLEGTEERLLRRVEARDCTTHKEEVLPVPEHDTQGGNATQDIYV